MTAILKACEIVTIRQGLGALRGTVYITLLFHITSVSEFLFHCYNCDIYPKPDNTLQTLSSRICVSTLSQHSAIYICVCVWTESVDLTRIQLSSGEDFQMHTDDGDN